MTKDFQDTLNKAGVPGFCQTEDRNQMKIQRHLVRLMQLIAQEMKEKKRILEKNSFKNFLNIKCTSTCPTN